MENMSIWASLDIESRNPKTLGRAYTCGVSNMGRYPFETQVRQRSVSYTRKQTLGVSLMSHRWAGVNVVYVAQLAYEVTVLGIKR